MVSWCERWNIEINEEKTRAIHFSRRLTPVEACLTMNRRNVPFVNQVKNLGVVFDSRIAWRLHIEMIEAKAFRTFVKMYSLLKNERFGTNIKLILHKALINSIMTYACPTREFEAYTILKLLRLVLRRIMQADVTSYHHNPNVRNI